MYLDIYERQLELFKRRLETMTVYFEPTIALFNPPTICTWEALARDPVTKKAPNELFITAELWGKQFLIELDIYFLHTAIRNFVDPENRQPYFRRPSDIQDLSVNVYPDTLVRRAYREAIQKIIDEGKFPLNKLILEISEKRALPLPEAPDQDMDQAKWFRRKLTYYSGKGIRFAVDDFGTGHASSSRLSHLRTAVIKIDRDALLHIYGEYIFEYVLRQTLETSANTQIVVEGLDESSNFSLAQLYKLGIRYVQGHALVKPKENVDRLHNDVELRIKQALNDLWM